MKEERIKQLRELASKATQPGPYKVTNHRNQARDNFTVLDANGFWVADFGNVKSEADYFAGAATAVPELLDLVEKLQAEARQDAAAREHALAAIAKLDPLRAALREACDLAEEANGAPSECLHNVPLGERIAELRKVAGEP